MAITLREMQKFLSLSRRDGVVDSALYPWRKTVARFANFVAGHKRFRRVVLDRGLIVNTCTCNECVFAGRTTNPQSLVDSLTRRYGPYADLDDVLNDLERAAAEKQPQQPQQNEQSQHEQPAQEQEPQNQQSQGGQGSDSDQDGDPDPDGAGEPDAQSQPQPGQSRAQPTGSAPESSQQPHPQQVLQQMKEAFREAVRTAQRQPNCPVAANNLRQAKKLLRETRKRVSVKPRPVREGPSLSARKHLTTSHGRLRRVPQNLRSQMAELINRLVLQAGTSGSQLGPIPVLSPRKLVNRMLVQRPLQNALKEDSVSGRPVTLFLPDISPSCEAQAQIACDLANAAGYAGISGSDVLVFPHCNGEVSAHEDYFPWLNGKPVTDAVREIPKLYEDVCTGHSRFKVRVVVLLGDHDAVHHYEKIAALKTVLRVVWLHNYRSSSDRRDAALEESSSFLAPGWSTEVMEKLSLVSGCTTTTTMLRGFGLAVK
jgi:hypothetical protein